jgi:single-strand DNA-binding protein
VILSPSQQINNNKTLVMKGNNVVQLIGYVGNHLRVFQRPSNKKVLIRVATHEKIKDNCGNEKEITAWHDIAAWNAIGDFAECSFVKGSHILVQGRLVHRTYLDQLGHIRYVTEIAADHLENLDR